LTYEWGENDVKLAGAARDKAFEMMLASGAREARVGLNYGAHAMGTCRMGNDPQTSVVNEFARRTMSRISSSAIPASLLPVPA
jgi:choline dehydrogenase-like flavoprotein